MYIPLLPTFVVSIAETALAVNSLFSHSTPPRRSMFRHARHAMAHTIGDNCRLSWMTGRLRDAADLPFIEGFGH